MSTIDNILNLTESDDFCEIPVSIGEFITNPEYLGNSTYNGERLYPYWRSFLTQFFDGNKYHEMLLSGAIGTGKTYVLSICACYVLYRLMCLKNLQEFFKLTPKDSISLFFLNTSVSNAEGVCFRTVHGMLLQRPWFMKHGKAVGRENIKYKPDKNIKLMGCSTPNHVLGTNIFAVFADEPVVKSVSAETTCLKLLKLYSQISARIVSRFGISGDWQGYKFMVTIKIPEHRVLLGYMDSAKNKCDVLISDEPQWNIKPKGTFSNATFAVAYGGNLLSPQIVPDRENAVDVFTDIGCGIVLIPDNYRYNAEADVVQLLRLAAGVEC